ncbi:MAG: heme lyase CcmF/NrfE family subunit [Sphingomonadaceae bacterium]|uniref:heme lyase CcmF/NrfE family subunit n=1 Tax=Thermaurantiacus sp. TaxID=2820283 RepID=UPI00298F1E45|nr:heme lyase CcmF/NrfE family subunit [Thermaurantiacus sp.]MCS6986485.1 heme lyase CcmF/NrfE family subunit [Sphingomonadaceae bacterium]MDW8414254.1 heme lyase CcmF/NrfE family subunit [Thermaurantiacus sp.]
MTAVLPPIPELGHLALWLALAAALVQAVAPWHARLGQAAAPAAAAQGLLVLGAFVALGWAFLVSDFSVELVTANSHTMKPTLYKLTGIWANHEGSMLLWVLILALAGLLVALMPAPLGPAFRARALGVAGMVSAGFLAFLLLASNPFTRIEPAPTEGRGLNPLLQDPGLAFHPPTLYVGYVGLVVAFALAVAALLEGRVSSDWARATRPWVAGAWAFLTLGIALGAWWAYYELGWGGWWFWDPVENAALMPWLVATALLHSIRVLETRGALPNWTLMLAILGFALSMLGTFIVRSGVLSSVHAFAVDPTRGLFLLVLLAGLTGGAFLVWALKAPRIAEGARFAAFSREGSLVLNNLLLLALLSIVLVGTLYPLALEGVSGRQISVGPPYFNATTLPIVLGLAVLMGVGPLLAWKRNPRPGFVRRLWPPLAAALAFGLIGLALGLKTVLAVLGFAAAGWLIVASLLPFVGRRRVPTFLALGTAIAHLGAGLALLGATASGALQREALVSLRVGDGFAVGGLEVRLYDVGPVAGPNWTALEATLHVSRDGRPVATLTPQSRTYTTPPMETTEAGIVGWRGGDLYAALGKPDGSGRWQIHFWIKPLVHLLWVGAVLMATGAAVAAGGRARMAWPGRARPLVSRPVPVPAE